MDVLLLTLHTSTYCAASVYIENCLIASVYLYYLFIRNVDIQ